jgi:gamma-glutamyl-gamma-aminobutyraldehyde dehydrogenase
MNTLDWSIRANKLDLQVYNFIDGCYTDITIGDCLMDKHSPRDGRLLYQLGGGTADDADSAVSNVQAAFDDGRWCALSMAQLQAVLRKLAELVETNH